MPTKKERARCARCHRRAIIGRDLRPITFSEYMRITKRWSYTVHYVCIDLDACQERVDRIMKEKRNEPILIM